ncbi:MAG: glycosyltransferase, partial [Armatimonadetes bacterium]|nr:glycosyltransferase [Armatimonadota bacterium]
MKAVITGGGTGGHVYPALEVGHAIVTEGFEIHYFGSQRGHEVRACRKADIPFQGFPSEPLYSLKSLRGLRAAANL